MALCTVTGTVYLPTGEVARSRVFVFSPASRAIYPDNFGGVLPDPVWVKTNRDGLLSVVLLTGAYTIQSDVYSGSVVVPDEDSASFYSILGGDSPLPGPPTVLLDPIASPDYVVVGSPVNLTLGSYSGATSVSGVLIQDGVNRTSQVVGGVWTPSAVGEYTWTVTAVGVGGSTVAPVVTGIVDSIPAPVLVASPSAAPIQAAVGEPVRLGLGTWEYSTSRAGVLMQGGINRASEITGSVWTPTTAGDFTWTVTATGPAGVTVADPVNGSVVASLRNNSYVYLDGNMPPESVGSPITSAVMAGTGGLTFTALGTGAEVTKEDDAVRNNLGKYLGISSSPVPSIDGFTMAADFTVNSLSGNQFVLQFMNDNTVIGQIRLGASLLQLVWGGVIAGTPNPATLGTAIVGGRYVVAVEFDSVSGQVRFWNPFTEVIETAAITFSGPIVANRIRIGQSANTSTHTTSITLRATGSAWPITLEDTLTNLGVGGSDPAVPDVTIHYDEGQSHPLGPNEGAVLAPNGSRWRDVIGANPDILMLNGLRRIDSQAVTHVAAPLLNGYDESVPASGYGPALIGGNVCGGMVTARALLRDGGEDAPMGFQFHGAAGQPISQFMPGTPIYSNAEHWLTQAVAVWGEAE